MRPIDEIIIHASATRADWMATLPTADKVAEIRRWHVKDRGWKDIGYHYLIDRNGTVATGRPVEQVGAHVAGHNTGTIGVCLIGGHGSSETDRFDEHFKAAQDKALRVLLADLKRKRELVDVQAKAPVRVGLADVVGERRPEVLRRYGGQEGLLARGDWNASCPIAAGGPAPT